MTDFVFLMITHLVHKMQNNGKNFPLLFFEAKSGVFNNQNLQIFEFSIVENWKK